MPRTHDADIATNVADRSRQAIGYFISADSEIREGQNRISAGRLQRIAGIFDVSISYFFGATDGDGEETAKIMTLLASRHSLRLLQAFSGIENHIAQLALVHLTEQLAKQL